MSPFSAVWRVFLLTLGLTVLISVGFLGVADAQESTTRRSPLDLVTTCAADEYATRTKEGIVCKAPTDNWDSEATAGSHCRTGQFLKVTPTGLQCFPFSDKTSTYTTYCSDCCGVEEFAVITTLGLRCAGASCSSDSECAGNAHCDPIINRCVQCVGDNCGECVWDTNYSCDSAQPTKRVKHCRFSGVIRNTQFLTCPHNGTCSGGACVCVPKTSGGWTAAPSCAAPSSVRCDTAIPDKYGTCRYGTTAACETIQCTGTRPTRTCTGRGTYCPTGQQCGVYGCYSPTGTSPSSYSPASYSSAPSSYTPSSYPPSSYVDSPPSYPIVDPPPSIDCSSKSSCGCLQDQCVGNQAYSCSCVARSGRCVLSRTLTPCSHGCSNGSCDDDSRGKGGGVGVRDQGGSCPSPSYTCGNWSGGCLTAGSFGGLVTGNSKIRRCTCESEGCCDQGSEWLEHGNCSQGTSTNTKKTYTGTWSRGSCSSSKKICGIGNFETETFTCSVTCSGGACDPTTKPSGSYSVEGGCCNGGVGIACTTDVQRKQYEDTRKGAELVVDTLTSNHCHTGGRCVTCSSIVGGHEDTGHGCGPHNSDSSATPPSYPPNSYPSDSEDSDTPPCSPNECGCSNTGTWCHGGSSERSCYCAVSNGSCVRKYSTSSCASGVCSGGSCTSAGNTPNSYPPKSYSPKSYSPKSYSPRSYSPRSYSPRSYPSDSDTPPCSPNECGCSNTGTWCHGGSSERSCYCAVSNGSCVRKYSTSSCASGVCSGGSCTSAGNTPNSYPPKSYSPKSYSPKSYSPRSYSPRSYSPRSYSKKPRSYSPRSYSPRSYSSSSASLHCHWGGKCRTCGEGQGHEDTGHSGCSH